ncbi:MAG: protein kinase family protein [Nocardioidaceae bacterium]
MSETPFGPGTVLAGRFTLDDLLDDTDGARFWRATDQTLARSVAVHVLADSDPRADSLLTAARTSALVSDGHLLRVLDAAAEDGVVYVVNEWGSGASLDQLLVEGPLSPRRAAWVVKEVAEAIATAHRNGVAHGRLLPEKVMITEAGTVKLVGFVVDAVLQDRAGRDQVRVTGGDPMSAHESDVVNLAGLLYAALVGRWPGTEGSSVPAAPVEHGRPLRPRQVRAGVPRPLDAICERVLNAGPHAHAVPIETAHEVYAALSDYIGDPAAAPQYESTTVLMANALMPADDTGPATQLSPAAQPDARSNLGPDQDTGDLAATGAFPAPVSAEEDAVDQTQAGVPVFFDEATGVGWMNETPGHGLTDEHTGSDGPAAPTRRMPSPPPPLPDAPERPLFAAGPARRSAEVAGSARGAVDTGSFVRNTGTGNVPAAWGPDPVVPEDDDRHDDDERRPGTSWLRLAAVLGAVVVLVLGIVFAFNLGRGSGDDPTAAEPSASSSASQAPPASKPVAISGVTDFDPLGDPPQENPDLAPLAADGKAATAWRTSTYYQNFPTLKEGVGLLVDLGKPTAVGSVKVSLLGDGTSLDVLAAPDAKAAPSSTDGLDTVASVKNAGAKADLELKRPVTTQWFVVWLTSLPSAPDGFQGRVAEISVSS